MTDEEFDEHVSATEKRDDGTVAGLDYCLLKLCAEAGEVAGLRGRETLVGPSPTHIARRAAYALELGDVRWYTVKAERVLGLTADQVKRLNVMKLRRRREKLPSGALRHGKDPSGELAEAIRILHEPTAETKPVVRNCACGHPMSSHSMRTMGCDDGCACRSHHGITPEPAEFQRCNYCEDWTRHRAKSHGYCMHTLSPVCLAIECRDMHERMLQRTSLK